MKKSNWMIAGAVTALSLGLLTGAGLAQQTSGEYRYQTGQQQYQTQQRGQSWTGQRQEVTRIHRASNLIGMEVRNFQNERVGRVEDLVVDPQTGQVAYAVLNANRLLQGRQTFVAIPLTAFQPSQDERHLMADLDRVRLQRMQTFERDDLPRLNDPSIEMSWGRTYPEVRQDRFGGEDRSSVRGQARYDDLPDNYRDSYDPARGSYRSQQDRYDTRRDTRFSTQSGDQGGAYQYEYGTGQSRQPSYQRDSSWSSDRQNQTRLDRDYDRESRSYQPQAEFDTRLHTRLDRYETRYDSQPDFSTRSGDAWTTQPRPRTEVQVRTGGDRAYTDSEARSTIRERVRERLPDGSVRGEVLAISPEERTITIRNEQGGISTFDISDQVTLNTLGNRYGRLTDIKVGHGVEVGYRDDGYGNRVAQTLIQTSGLESRP